MACDCDKDTLLLWAHPRGPVCHLGFPSCFTQGPAPLILGRLWELLQQRKAQPEGSGYTRQLLRDPPILRDKILEEAQELVAALASENQTRVAEEAADLAYHVLVGLVGRDVAWTEVSKVLEKRFKGDGETSS